MEISRATQPITVSVPVKNKPAESRTFPRADTSSAWISPTAASPTRCSTTMHWAPDDPQRQPYDDTAWTFPELFNVKATRAAWTPSC